MFHPELNLIANLTLWTADDARDGKFISLKNVHRAFICALVHQGADGTVQTLTLKQATGGAGTATGTAEKALLVDSPVYYNEATWESSNILTAGVATLGVHVCGVDQTRAKLIVFDIIPERDMDVANNFDCIGIDFSDLGALALGGAFAILIPARYSPLPTVFAD